jgi:hypothetical protein
MTLPFYPVDNALNEYDAGCDYKTYEDTDFPEFGNIWYTDYVSAQDPALPAPDKATLLAISEALEDEGAFLELPGAIEGYLKLTALPIYQKIVDSVITKPSVMLYAIMAQQAIMTALEARNKPTLNLAQRAWERFVNRAKLERPSTGITVDDIAQLNQLIDDENLPPWLKL